MERKPSDPFAELYGDYSQKLRGDRWRPNLDVYETEKAVVVRVELAGVRRGDVRVAVEGETLRIRGERLPPSEPNVRRHHQMEIAFGPFECDLRLAVPFERDQVAARFEEGFLVVTLPKRGSTQRSIEVTKSEPER